MKYVSPAFLLAAAVAIAQSKVEVSEVAPNVVVFATSGGNVVTSVGPDGALLIGTPSADSTQEISRILDSRTKSPIRYVVIMPHDPWHSQGDAGWGKRGAFVVMQEKALEHFGGHQMGASQPIPKRLTDLGVARPTVAFSEVITFDMNGNAIHIVHQPPGYSDADSIVHFHVSKLVYLGEVFPGDGYPMVDAKQSGSLDGLLKTLAHWMGGNMVVVPARGKVTNSVRVKTFHDMIVAAQTRVAQMKKAGKTVDEVIAAHPTAEYDVEWGHGRVSPTDFVRELYEAAD